MDRRESGVIIFKNAVYLVFHRFVVAMELERHRLEVSLLLQNHHWVEGKKKTSFKSRFLQQEDTAVFSLLGAGGLEWGNSVSPCAPCRTAN